MHSKHAYILALMSGAAALLVVLTGLLGSALLESAEPYLSGRAQEVESNAPASAPLFTTTVEGSNVRIVEVDKAGRPLRTIFSSDLNDAIADFSLLAVPQDSYAGNIYLQSVQDADGAVLIVYPLDVETGKLAPATLNVASNQAIISPEQDRVAVINTTQAQNITAYDLATGTVLASWTPAAGERFSETGVRWTSNNCFDHALQTFCIDPSGN
jgi:hypothetical protein